MAIPRTIYTYWINENPDSMPDMVKTCIESQQVPGYEHRILTIEDCDIGSQYVKDCISRHDVKGYVKASDYMRCYYVWKYGGIALDGDMEILEGKNFDHLLHYEMFVPMDPQGHFGNAGFGAEQGHPLLKHYLDRIENNFKGDGEFVYEPGIRGFSDMFYISDISKIQLLTSDYFFPYNHQKNTENITENTLVKHHYMNSWIDKK